ncbi:MAG: hypothetical protein J5821_02600 [Alphaproteobacteria bacterium]|nr:hypothetical protein [Alphaproteobacteria bacterium]
MCKNFSYIFGLGALLMLAACDSGDKKSTDGNKESVAESQEASTAVTEEGQSKKISENKRARNRKTAEENQVDEYEGIYADINRPIEDEVSTSAQDGRVGAKSTNIKVSESENEIADNVTAPGKEESKDTKPANNSTDKSDTETRKGVSKAEDNPKADAENRTDNMDTMDSTDATDDRQSDTNEKHIDANEGNVENSSETPEVSMESDVPVISEESSEHQQPVEVDQTSESNPNADSESAEDDTEN